MKYYFADEANKSENNSEDKPENNADEGSEGKENKKDEDGKNEEGKPLMSPKEARVFVDKLQSKNDKYAKEIEEIVKRAELVGKMCKWYGTGLSDAWKALKGEKSDVSQGRAIGQLLTGPGIIRTMKRIAKKLPTEAEGDFKRLVTLRKFLKKKLDATDFALLDSAIFAYMGLTPKQAKAIGFSRCDSANDSLQRLLGKSYIPN